MWCHSEIKRICLPFLLVGSLLLIACESAKLEPDSLTLGEAFPDLTITTLTGEAISLKSLQGKVVLLNVWATWCPPCRKELPSLEKLGRILNEQPFEVVGMSIDNDYELVQEYLADQGVTYKNYIDVNGQATNEILGIVAYPHTFLISKEGYAVARYAGEQVWHTRSMVEQIKQEMNAPR